MALFYSNFEKAVREMAQPIRSVAMNPKRTVVINVDTINGFFRIGALSSPRLEAVIPKIMEVNEYFAFSRKVFFVDRHTDSSPELKVYPSHCVEDEECQIIDELQNFAKSSNSTIIHKNSTNGFFSNKFVLWLRDNIEVTDNFVVTGGATDICVMQFVLSLKAYFNESNMKQRVAIVENAIQTFDSENHDGNKMHAFAVYNMMMNGVNVYTI